MPELRDRPGQGSGGTDENTLRLAFPASLGAIDRAVDAARAFLYARAEAGTDLFPVLVILREALLNAVVHGCGKNPALQVQCALTLAGREALLEIRDPGPGFDWKTRPPAMPPTASTSGRGRYIMSLYARAMDYNEAGNALTLRIALG